MARAVASAAAESAALTVPESAGFEGFPVNPDGSNIPVDVSGDIVYTTFLKRIKGVWNVVKDLSGSDVPSDKEVTNIRNKFPADFPTSVLPDFWRKRLRP
jgi:hypothetical protein